MSLFDFSVPEKGLTHLETRINKTDYFFDISWNVDLNLSRVRLF